MQRYIHILTISTRVAAILTLVAAAIGLWRLMLWLPWQVDCLLTAGAVIAFAYRFEHDMTVRIVKRPTGTWDGVPLNQYIVGKSYEVSRSIGDYLVLQGCAVTQQKPRRRRKSANTDR